MPPQRCLCLFFPHLASDRARRTQRTSTAMPLALTQQHGRSTRVAEVDARAHAAGVRPGMTLAQAHALLPTLVALPSDPAGDEAFLGRLADWAVRFSPLVEARPPDVLVLDVTGCAHLFGGEEALLSQAVRPLVQAGLDTRGALADTVGAAVAVAVSAEVPVSLVPTGQTRARLASLAPAALRLEPQAVERLERLGVRTIGQLLELPRKGLPARFGAGIVRRLQAALGELRESVASRIPAEPLQASAAFEPPLSEADQLHRPAEHLLEDIFRQLDRRQLALRELALLVYRADAPPLVVPVRLARPSRARAHVLTLVRERLQAVPVAAGLCGLLLRAVDTAAWQPGQIDLFEPQEPHQEEELGALLDRLTSRLGEQGVLRARLVEDYQPEQAYAVEPAGATPTEPGAGAAPLSARPTQLLPRPLPLRVMARVPDGPPSWLAWQGREYAVREAWGPERIETAWWRGPDVQRDYFRILTTTGEQFWVFRDRRSGQWYLHGLFT